MHPYAPEFFPDIFKTAKIKPLFKKGKKMKFKIIGQFLFLSVFFKNIRLFYVRMKPFSIKRRVFKCEHGFREIKISETAIFSFLKVLPHHWIKTKQLLEYFLDLSKAFDRHWS